MPPECEQFAHAVAAARGIVTRDRAATNLRRYLANYTGRFFTPAVAGTPPNVITPAVVRALRHLRAGVPHAYRTRLLVATRTQITTLLRGIPQTLDLSALTPANYTAVLGRRSHAWQLWDLLGTILYGARRSGRWVTTSKLLHAKRPRLVPILDSRIRCHLGLGRSDQWEAIWCSIRDPQVLRQLQRMRTTVPGAATLSVLRIFDIVVWMEGPCPRGGAPIAGGRPVRPR